MTRALDQVRAVYHDWRALWGEDWTEGLLATALILGGAGCVAAAAAALYVLIRGGP